MDHPTPQSEVDAILQRLAAGDHSVFERLMPLVYQDLHRMAMHFMQHERPDHTLQPTALVHEAYLRLAGHCQPNWSTRAHFLAMAARLMRRILIDHARARLSAKRGGGAIVLGISETQQIQLHSDDGLLALDEVLHKLEELDARQAQIVEMRFFGGLTMEETAETLGVSSRTVDREWLHARAWLFLQLQPTAAKRGSRAAIQIVDKGIAPESSSGKVGRPEMKVPESGEL